MLAPSFNLHGPTIDNFVFHPSLRALIRSMFVDEYWLQEWTIISCSFFLLIDSLGQTAIGSTGIATKRYVRRTALFLLFGTREKCLLLSSLCSLKIFHKENIEKDYCIYLISRFDFVLKFLYKFFFCNV